jgi:hypothetical protein
MIPINSSLLNGLAKGVEEASVPECIALWDAFLLDLGSGYPPRAWEEAADALRSYSPLRPSKLSFPGLYFGMPRRQKLDLIVLELVEWGEMHAVQTGEGHPVSLENFVKTVGQSFFEYVLITLGYTRQWQQIGVRALGTALLMSDFFADAGPYQKALILPIATPASGPSSDGAGVVTGRVTAEIETSVVWKYVIRTQQSLADAIELSKDLSRAKRRIFKVWWFTCLEITARVEKDARIWSKPPLELTRFQRAQVWFQSRFGRVTFRR